MAKKFRDVQPVFDFADNLLRGLAARLEKIIARRNSRRARQPARSIGGRRQVQLLGSVGIEELRVKHSIFNHDRAPRGNALPVEGRSAEATRHRAIVDNRDIRTRNPLAQFPGEK
jgi:hypothetical protein